MSTLKADAVTAKSTNTDVTITGAGTGVPNIESGFKVGGTAGLPINNLRAGTDGELITWDASGDPAAVAVGTATHVLTSNGIGAAPTFQAAAAGGSLTLISSVTASDSATIDFTSGIDSTYALYIFRLSALIPANDDVTMHMRYRISGSFSSSSHYYFSENVLKSYTAGIASGKTEDGDNIQICDHTGNTAADCLNGTIQLWNPGSTSLLKTVWWHCVNQGPSSSPKPKGAFGLGGYLTTTVAVTGLQFYFASGNIASGTARVYGVANS